MMLQLQPQFQWDGVGIPEQKGRLRWRIGHIYQSWTPNVVMKFSEIRRGFPDVSSFAIEWLSNDGLQLDIMTTCLWDVVRVEYQHFVSSATGIDLCGGIRVVLRDHRAILCLINGAIVEEFEPTTTGDSAQ